MAVETAVCPAGRLGESGLLLARRQRLVRDREQGRHGRLPLRGIAENGVRGPGLRGARMSQTHDIDFLVRPQGTVWLFEPVTERAKHHTLNVMDVQGWQWLGPAFGVDHRLAL